jgi:hypothetical protein
VINTFLRFQHVWAGVSAVFCDFLKRLWGLEADGEDTLVMLVLFLGLLLLRGSEGGVEGTIRDHS